jgi:hypothetical protein
MAKYTIAEACHVSIVLDGEVLDLDLTAGDVELAQPVADLLIAQGLASEATKSSKKTSVTEVVAETPSEPTQE